MTHEQILESLDGVAGTVAGPALGSEAGSDMEELTGALATLTKCVQALAERLAVHDGQLA